ncbi:MAG: hypothetical protein RLY31_2303 [Bacteroidota bacterium]|jgi:Icc protein
MTILQITDLHLSHDNVNLHKVDTRGNFLALLRKAVSMEPDLLVLTGDICYEAADPKVYGWVREQLEHSGLPYVVIGGNHDETDTLVRVFSYHHRLTAGELYFVHPIGDRQLVFLESSTGQVSDRQLEWLAAVLSRRQDAALVFMHHPPLSADVPFMDEHYPLRNGAAVRQVLEAAPVPVHVFCGHYHVERSLIRKNLTVHITPSCYFQLDAASVDFRIDHFRAGLRCIRIQDDGTLATTVVYL